VWYFIEYLVTCDSPIVVFDGLISLIKGNKLERNTNKGYISRMKKRGQVTMLPFLNMM